MAAKTVLAAAKTTLAVTKTVLAVAMTILAAAKTVMAAARTVLAVAKTVLAAAKGRYVGGRRPSWRPPRKTVLAAAKTVFVAVTPRPIIVQLYLSLFKQPPYGSSWPCPHNFPMAAPLDSGCVLGLANPSGQFNFQL